MKIFIDPGHGGSDPGAVSHIKEAQYTLSYALKLGRVLTLLGFTVAYSRKTDTTVSLAQRVALANAFKADYFASIHFNAGGGIGIETFALQTGGQGEKLAKAVQSALISATGSKSRGVKFSNFYVLKNTDMSAILIEGGFVDSVSDAQRIQTEDFKRKYIQGVTKGICACTGTAWRDLYDVSVPPVVAVTVAYRIILDNKQIMAVASQDKAIAEVKKSVDSGTAIKGIVQRNTDGVSVFEYVKPVVVVPPVVPTNDALAVDLLNQAIQLINK